MRGKINQKINPTLFSELKAIFVIKHFVSKIMIY